MANLQPCKTAFIDAHTPGSATKKRTLPSLVAACPKAPISMCTYRYSAWVQHWCGGPAASIAATRLHDHQHGRGILCSLKGRWRFFWGRYGDAGEVTLEEGDIFNIPTGIFRGFENIGTDYGMITG